MSEADSRPAGAVAGTAGALLRQAREKQGLHIGALSAAIKVSQRKLEALEADRIDELPDATFARALAQTVCRQLKIDPGPVLALLPPPKSHRLEHLGEGINETFRESAGRLGGDGISLASPAVWAAGLVLLAAVVVYLLPPGLLDRGASTVGESAPAVAASSVIELVPVAPQSASAAAAAVAGAAASEVPAATVETVHAAPDPAAAASDAAVSPPVAGVLQLRTNAESWIEVRNGTGQVVLQRLVLPGETLGLDGALPFKLKIGNAAATQLVFRGQPVDLAASTRDNVARLELK